MNNEAIQTVRYLNNNGKFVFHKSNCSNLKRIHHANCLKVLTDAEAAEEAKLYNPTYCAKCFPEKN